MAVDPRAERLEAVVQMKCADQLHADRLVQVAASWPCIPSRCPSGSRRQTRGTCRSRRPAGPGLSRRRASAARCSNRQPRFEPWPAVVSSRHCGLMPRVCRCTSSSARAIAAQAGLLAAGGVGAGMRHDVRDAQPLRPLQFDDERVDRLLPQLVDPGLARLMRYESWAIGWVMPSRVRASWNRWAVVVRELLGPPLVVVLREQLHAVAADVPRRPPPPCSSRRQSTDGHRESPCEAG